MVVDPVKDDLETADIEPEFGFLAHLGPWEPVDSQYSCDEERRIPAAGAARVRLDGGERLEESGKIWKSRFLKFCQLISGSLLVLLVLTPLWADAISKQLNLPAAELVSQWGILHFLVLVLRSLPASCHSPSAGAHSKERLV